MSVNCPVCGAVPGQPCMGKRRVRRSVHRERLQIENAPSKRASVPKACLLGFRDYDAYINSAQWANRCEQFFAIHGYRCMICDHNRNLHLHHTTYCNLGHENDEDLVALCSTCHMVVHTQRHFDRATVEQLRDEYQTHGRFLSLVKNR